MSNFVINNYRITHYSFPDKVIDSFPALKHLGFKKNHVL